MSHLPPRRDLLQLPCYAYFVYVLGGSLTGGCEMDDSTIVIDWTGGKVSATFWSQSWSICGLSLVAFWSDFCSDFGHCGADFRSSKCQRRVCSTRTIVFITSIRGLTAKAPSSRTGSLSSRTALLNQKRLRLRTRRLSRTRSG